MFCASVENWLISTAAAEAITRARIIEYLAKRVIPSRYTRARVSRPMANDTQTIESVFRTRSATCITFLE